MNAAEEGGSSKLISSGLLPSELSTRDQGICYTRFTHGYCGSCREEVFQGFLNDVEQRAFFSCKEAAAIQPWCSSPILSQVRTGAAPGAQCDLPVHGASPTTVQEPSWIPGVHEPLQEGRRVRAGPRLPVPGSSRTMSGAYHTPATVGQGQRRRAATGFWRSWRTPHSLRLPGGARVHQGKTKAAGYPSQDSRLRSMQHHDATVDQ